jgi:hypothetical protein
MEEDIKFDSEGLPVVKLEKEIPEVQPAIVGSKMEANESSLIVEEFNMENLAQSENAVGLGDVQVSDGEKKIAPVVGDPARPLKRVKFESKTVTGMLSFSRFYLFQC